MNEAYKKNQEIELDIIDMSHDGEGIGKTGAFTWFIKDTVIGDRVKAVVMKTKKSYGYARLTKIIKKSDDRVEPSCNIARACGGCSLQMMSYSSQLRYKENKVKNNLIRIGGFDSSYIDKIYEGISGMEYPFRYRNKAQYPIGRDKSGNIAAGFYAGRTHSIVKCDDCLIGDKINKVILDAVIAYMNKYNIEPYRETDGSGIVRHVLIRKGFASGEVMCCIVVTTDKIANLDKLISMLDNAADIKSIVLNINPANTNVILGDKTKVLTGDGYISDYIGDVKFRISARSFYQVNPVQTKVLYESALSYAGLSGGEVVWDLYCGIGTISLFMAKSSRRVYGVEVVPEAIEDAKENARINNISNASFVCARAEDIGSDNKFEKPDVIVVDPPRKGCDSKCLDTILKVKPDRVVYVSCDSATLARDLRLLCESGEYRLEKFRAVDMFPQTGHTEVVTSLVKVW